MSQLCRFSQCPKPCRERGYCKAHAGRLRRWGDPAGKNVLNGAHQPGVYVDPGIGRSREPDAALIVYAVNRLPDYEALADAAHELLTEWDLFGPTGTQDTLDTHKRLRDALQRLRPEAVPA